MNTKKFFAVFLALFLYSLVGFFTPNAHAAMFNSDIHIHSGNVETPATLLDKMKSKNINVGNALIYGATQVYDAGKFIGQVNDPVSEANNILRWDVEISHLPGHFNGHMIMLNLSDLNVISPTTVGYPGQDYLFPNLNYVQTMGGIAGYDHADRWPIGNLGMPAPEPGGDYIAPFELPLDVALGKVDFLATQNVNSPNFLWLWYDMLNAGFHIAPAAGSDFPVLGPLGGSQSMVELDAATPFTFQNYINAIRAGKTVIRRGIAVPDYLDIKVNGFGLGSEVNIPSSATVTVQIDARSTNSTQAEIILNGNVFQTINITNTLATYTVSVPISKSSWIAVRTPDAHTAATFVLVDGKAIRNDPAAALRWRDYLEQYYNWGITQIREDGQTVFAGSAGLIRIKVDEAKAVWAAIAQEGTTPPPPTPAPLAHWRFDAGSGSVAVDSSGNNWNGTIVGNITWTTGKANGGLQFDGSTSYITVGDISAVQNLSIEAWIFIAPGTNGDRMIMSKGSEYDFRINDTGILSATTGNTTLNYPSFNFYSTGNTNQWHHLVYTFDDTLNTHKLYRNGVEVASGTNTGSVFNSPDSLWLGRHTNINFATFLGKLDEVKVYGQALTSGEVLALYNQTVPPIISTISSGSPTASSAIVTWTTDELSDSQIEYGLTTSYESQTTLDTNLVTDHSVSLSGLSASTTYNFRVKSKDASGNLAVSGNGVFTTLIPPSNFLPGYGFRRTIDITDSQVSGGTHTNFPVLVSTTLADLKTVGNGGDVTDIEGDDIVFTDSDGLTQFAHEVEKYDPVTGNLVAWVRVPTLTFASTLYIYYSNSSVTTFQGNITSNGVTGVWDNSYKGVWHLPNGTTLSGSDSTSNTFNGVLNNGVAAGTGKISGGASFDGTNDNIGFNAINSTFSRQVGSLGLWVNLPPRTSTIKSVMHIRTNGSNEIEMIDFDSQYGLNFRFKYRNLTVNTSAITDNATWHHAVMTWDTGADQFKVYVDGLQVGTTRTGLGTGWTNPPTGSVLGANTALNGFMPGSLDEVRISNTVRSAGWIATEYNNQNFSSGFYVVGGEEV